MLRRLATSLLGRLCRRFGHPLDVAADDVGEGHRYCPVCNSLRDRFGREEPSA